MKFRTELSIVPNPNPISYEDPVMFIGSCFSQNMGLIMQKYKFNVTINPFGTIFNPISISKVLQSAIDKSYPSIDQLHHSQGIWVHPDYHSVLSSSDQNTTIVNIKTAIDLTHNNLRKAHYIFITLGTSYAYVLNDSKEVVSNCHKLPSSMFTKTLLPLQDSLEALQNVILRIQQFNPNVHIVITVSPVRHIKDGIIENQRSKARLIEVAHTLTENLQNVSYFPAYEWLMDDLRDYRFYSDDLIHPAQNAIQYIWEKFSDHYFNTQTLDVLKEVQDILNAGAHTLFQSNSAESIDFKKRYTEKIHRLVKKQPYLNFDQELDKFAHA